MSQALGKLREYETLLVLHPELTDDGVTKALDQLKEVLNKKGATLLREEKQGKKKLAFEVKKHVRGNFVLLHYVGAVGTVAELERTSRNSDSVIRFLTTVHGDVADVEAKKAEVDKMVQKRAAEKAKAEAEAKQAAEAKAAEEAAAQGGGESAEASA